MATANGYRTEREIVDQARTLVAEKGIEWCAANAPWALYIMVSAWKAEETVVAAFAAEKAANAVLDVVQGLNEAPRDARAAWVVALRDIGPWGCIAIYGLWLLAKQTGITLTGLLG